MMAPPIITLRPRSMRSQLPGTKLPSHRVAGSPSMAIAGDMLCGEREEAAACHSLRGGSESSAPQATEAPSAHQARAMELVSTPTQRYCNCAAFLAGRGRDG